MSEPIAAASVIDITADLPAEPYPGLRPFNQDEWAIFFGRDAQILRALDRIRGMRNAIYAIAKSCRGPR